MTDTIYEELTKLSGPHTIISRISKNLTGHDIYASYHFDNFKKTNAQRDTLVRFDEFLVPKNLTGNKIFDFGSCLGALTFECARRECDNVIGFEYCEERVNVCNKLAKHLNLSNIKFVKTDVNEESKSPQDFIDMYGTCDIIFCCSLDAYVNQDRLYSFVSKVTNNICFFETNSGIEPNEFKSKMKENGFSMVIWLGVSKSDQGYGRNSYILKKEREILMERTTNSKYDHVLSKFFDHVVIENIPFNDTTKSELLKQYYEYENELIECYNKIKNVQYISPVTFYSKCHIRRFYKQQLLLTEKTKDVQEKVRKQIILLIKKMNEAGVAHRDIHIGNIYFENESIVLCDFEFLTKNEVDIKECYDLTGKGLESPLGSLSMNIFSDNPCAISNFLDGNLTINDFL